MIHFIHFYNDTFHQSQMSNTDRGSRARAKSVIPILIILVTIRHKLLVFHIK